MLRIDANDLEFDENDVCRLNGELFSGVAFEINSNGAIRSETTYVGGCQDGLARHWDRDGQLRSEGTYYGSSDHGVLREWYPDGRLQAEILVEFGAIISERRFDEDGNLTCSKDIDPNCPAYQIILSMRNIHQRPRK